MLSRSRLTDDDVSTVSARLWSGALVSAVFREDARSASGITLFGSRGSADVPLLRFDAPPHRRPPGARRALRGLRARRSGGELLASYRAEWEHFLESVRVGLPPRCTLDDGVEALRIALAAAESAETGQPIEIHGAPRTARARVP